MFEKVKEFLNDYISEIDKQSNQDFESIQYQYKKRAELVYQTLPDLNKQIYSHWNIKNTKELYKDRLSEFEGRDRDSSDIVSGKWKSLIDEDLYVEILKLMLSKNYNLPTTTISIDAQEGTEIRVVTDLIDAQNHLLTLFIYYKFIAPTLPDIPLKMMLRIDYAMARLVDLAAVSCLVGHHRGPEHDRFTKQDKADEIKEANMLGLITQICGELNIHGNTYRTAGGKLQPYAVAGEIKKKLGSERFKKQLGEISKRYKNGTKTPDEETIVKYLKGINRE